MKNLWLLGALFITVNAFSQTCPNYIARTNGNGQPARCGTPGCSGAAKTGDIDMDYGGACPGITPTLTLLDPVISGFCFDPGKIESTVPCQIHYCFRGQNLPNSGNVVIRFTQGASNYSCIYSANGGLGILPVGIANFTAATTNNQTCISWDGFETNTVTSFVIENSKDGVDFFYEGSAAVKPLLEKTSYKFCTTAKPNTSYYRLKITSNTNRILYSEVVKVNGYSKKNITMRTEASGNVLNFTASTGTISNYNYQIVNSVGQPVQKGIITGSQVNISTLSKSVFYIIVTAPDGEVVYQDRFIK